MKILAFLSVLLMAIGCRNAHQTIIVIKPAIEQGSYILLEKLGYNGRADQLLDSAKVQKAGDSVIFKVPSASPALFRVSSRGHLLQVTLVNDAPSIHVRANFISNTASVKGSPGYASLAYLKKIQVAAGTESRRLYEVADSLKSLSGTAERLRYKKINQSYQNNMTAFYERYIHFADTVKNPALFMQVFPTLEFRNNFKRQKAFMLRAAKKFKTYAPIQELKNNVLELIRIYEIEYQVGQKLPNIELPDDKGNTFSTSKLKGKYYLIDFWSSFCDQCLVFKDEEAKVRAQIPTARLQIVSVALDDNKVAWAKLISNKKRTNWTHLIDVKRFQGPTVKAIAFDSIPYNILVSPDGTIIKKAIVSDSLLIVLKWLPL